MQPHEEQFLVDTLETEIGVLRVVCDERGALRVLDWDGHEERIAAVIRRQCGTRAVGFRKQRDPFGVSGALLAYFGGAVGALDGLAVASPGTPFQELVWRGLRTIPVGKTASYGELAVRIGRPKASRAVGMANHENPVAIVVPCHRVIGADGSLTGYAGGLERKQWLLDHERRHCGLSLQQRLEWPEAARTP
jgi:methylated-DNA-[protein]-cysteine S-methyltransferase